MICKLEGGINGLPTSHYIDQVVSSSWSSCFSLLGFVITGVHHCAQPETLRSLFPGTYWISGEVVSFPLFGHISLPVVDYSKKTSQLLFSSTALYPGIHELKWRKQSPSYLETCIPWVDSSISRRASGLLEDRQTFLFKCQFNIHYFETKQLSTKDSYYFKTEPRTTTK